MKPKAPQAMQAPPAPDLTEEVIREKAKEALQPSKTDTKVAQGLLAIGALTLGGAVLKNILSDPQPRFRAQAATTAREIGESIRLRRKDLGLTQIELAEKSGTRERFVCEVERGKETAEVGKVLDLLDALGLETRIATKG